MPGEIGIQLIEMCVLLTLSAFFSGSETALFSLTRKQVREYRDGKSLTGNIIYEVVSRPRLLLLTVLLGNMIVNVMFCSIGFMLARHVSPHRGPVNVAVNALALLALIVFGEVAPKSVAVRVPAAFSKICALPIFFLQKAMQPVAWLLRLITGTPRTPEKDHSALTAQELKQILDYAVRGGFVGGRLSSLVSEIVDFRDIRVREVMVPRVDVIAFRKTDGIDALISLIREKKVKNIPVFEEYKDNIVGIISAKDVFSTGTRDPSEFIRPVLFVPESKSIESLLTEFQEKRQKFAVVINEHGAMEGIVTIEDILEEIVGEIEDEFDRRTLHIRPTGKYLTEVPGDLSLRDFNEKFGMDLKAGQVATIGGYVTARLGALPKPGDAVDCGSIALRVSGVGRNRVTGITVERRPRKEQTWQSP